MHCARAISRYLFLLPAVFFAAAPAWSQPLKVDVDHAVFAASPGESVLGLYVMISGDDVSGVTRKSLTARFTPADGEGPTREASATAAGHPLGYLIASMEAVLPAGEYEVEIFQSAGEAAERILARKRMTVNAFSAGRQALISGIVLAKGADDDRLGDGTADRASLALDPKPDLVFGRSHSRLYYYFEAYNVDLAVSDGESYAAVVFIADANRSQPIAQWRREVVREASPRDRVAGVFSIDSLPSGSYRLVAQLRREDGHILAEESKLFFAFNPGVPPLAADESMSAMLDRPAALSDTELDRMMRQVRIIANQAEAGRLRRLSTREEKLAFLDQFWSTRQANDAHRGDRTMVEFLRRIDMVNARFGTERREGWETDQGATVLKYGQPHAVYEEDFKTGTNFPYEIWQYGGVPGVGSVMFVFIDRSGFGEFELIHSTMPGERRNVNWRREIMRPR